jgi:hypothetical protein
VLYLVALLVILPGVISCWKGVKGIRIPVISSPVWLTRAPDIYVAGGTAASCPLVIRLCGSGKNRIK